MLFPFLPFNFFRASYTHRILDIVSSLDKQTKDIDKITTDIRAIQKTLNITRSALERADTVAEELIFVSASADINDREKADTYRRLKRLRSTFNDSIETVNKIGQLDTIARDLEAKIEEEQRRLEQKLIEEENLRVKKKLEEEERLKKLKDEEERVKKEKLDEEERKKFEEEKLRKEKELEEKLKRQREKELEEENRIKQEMEEKERIRLEREEEERKKKQEEEELRQIEPPPNVNHLQLPAEESEVKASLGNNQLKIYNESAVFLKKYYKKGLRVPRAGGSSGPRETRPCSGGSARHGEPRYANVA